MWENTAQEETKQAVFKMEKKIFIKKSHGALKHRISCSKKQPEPGVCVEAGRKGGGGGG